MHLVVLSTEGTDTLGSVCFSSWTHGITLSPLILTCCWVIWIFLIVYLKPPCWLDQWNNLVPPPPPSQRRLSTKACVLSKRDLCHWEKNKQIPISLKFNQGDYNQWPSTTYNQYLWCSFVNCCVVNCKLDRTWRKESEICLRSTSTFTSTHSPDDIQIPQT